MTTAAVVDRRGDDLLVTPRLGLLPEMKTLGATWDKKSGAWKLPASRMHLESVVDLLGDSAILDMDLGDFDGLVDRQDRVAVDDDRLFRFQRDAVARLGNTRRGALLVASPGLGKTAMSIVAADQTVPDQVVVVAPASLLRNWEREIARWCRGDSSTAIVRANPDWEQVRASRWIVISWDTLALHQDWFVGSWPLWILDESVLAKSRSSTRALAMRGGTRRGRAKPDGTRTPDKRWANLRRGVDRVWLLSGSPTTRYDDDLWSQLAMIWPRAFPSYWRFAERYCVVEDNVWSTFGKTVVATRRDRDAVRDNSDLVMVINEKDVLDLPEYLFESVDVELTPKQRAAYDEMERDFVATLDSGDQLVSENRMSQLMRLQQIASCWEGSSAKHDALVELVEGGAYATPLLVWTYWREGARVLTERLAKAGLKVGHAHGDLNESAKDREIQGYVKGQLDALVLSVGVGKFGLTLINTRTMAYVDKTWAADDYFQSLRRGRRIGLTHRPLVATLRAPGTVDELVELNLEGKIEGISRVTNASLRELLNGLGRPSTPGGGKPSRGRGSLRA